MSTKTGKRISIQSAKNIANDFGYTQVIVVAFDKGTGITSVCTYGKSQEDCVQAAEGGNFVKKALGWPESAINAKPSRQVKNEKLMEVVAGIVSVIKNPSPDDTINLAKFVAWATIAEKIVNTNRL